MQEGIRWDGGGAPRPGVDRPLTVSELNASIRSRLEGSFPRVWLSGELSDVTIHASGHVYFTLKDGDAVLIAEGCTHHRQCNDIGSVKIPRALAKMTGKSLKFEFSSGTAFPPPMGRFSLVVQCGGCMLTRREVLRRIGAAREAGVPIVNYGMVLAAANGLKVEDVLV